MQRADRLLVFFQPTQPDDSDQIRQFGRVYSFDTDTGILAATSEEVTGEFHFNPLALSPNGELLAVISSHYEMGEDPIFRTATLEIEKYLPNELEISWDFYKVGTAAFVNDDELWIPNDAESVPEESIVVYNLVDESTRFVEDASRTLLLLPDADNQRVFIASYDLQSLYLFDTSSTQLTTQVAITALPLDVEVDSKHSLYHILSTAGQLFLVSDSAFQVDDAFPHLVNQRFDVSNAGAMLEISQGAPSRGLLFDSVGERLFARRTVRSAGLILEPLSYHILDELPIPVEAMALDATQNHLYSVGPVSDADLLTRVVRKLDLETLAVESTATHVVNACTDRAGVVGMEVDPDKQELWVLSPVTDLCDPLEPWVRKTKPATLTVYDILDHVTKEAEYEFPSSDSTWKRTRVGELVLDPERSRALLSFQPGDRSIPTSILTFPFDSDPLEPSGEILLPTDTAMMDRVYDVAEDLKHDLLYYLTFYRQTSEYFLAALDLRSDTFEGVWHLNFLDKSTVARIGFDPVSNRFAAVSAPDSIVYLFDNPVSPTRRPPPTVIPSGKTGTDGVTGGFGQTIAGIELDWEVGTMFADRIEGWIVERREDPELGLKPSAEWINLTPVQLPADLSEWTDTTADRGTSYYYRIRPITDGTLPAQPLDLGPVASGGDSRQWVATVPEVAVFMQPDSTRELLIAVETLDRRLQPVTIRASSTDPQVEVSVSPRQIPIPGTTRLFLNCTAGTPPGTYAATVTVSDAAATQTVSTVVQVPRPGQRVLTERILRAPTRITLLSDSDLDQKRMSVRGQLGIQRRLASPTSVIVKALLPTGETLSASGGVVAPTGEFTAEFAVPPTSPPGEEWFVRATWKGSLDAVGGNSVPFNLPVFTNSPKNLGPELPQSEGNVLLVQGLPPEEDTSDDLARRRNKSHRELNRRRFFAKENTLVSDATPLKEDVVKTIEGMRESKYFLACFLGDATDEHPEGFAFYLNENEVLTPVISLT